MSIFNEPEEKGLSFSENAKIKSLFGFKKSQLPCFADDSGICIESLNWKPGILSKRFLNSFKSNDDCFRSVIKSIKSNLKINGLAVIDFLNINYVLNNLVEKEEKIINNTEFIINRCLEDDMLVKSISITHENKIYDFKEEVKSYRIEDFLSIFKKLNLKLIKTYGDYKLNTFNKDSSPRLIMVVK